MATAKQQSIRLTAVDVAILEEIQRRNGLLRLSDAMRFALHHYAAAEELDASKPKPSAQRRKR
jgi:hypothetical protein